MSIHAEAEAIVHELFRTEAGRRDPHPRYRRLRQIAPVHRSEVAHMWIVTSHEHVRSIVRDPRFERRYEQVMDRSGSNWRSSASLTWASRIMLLLDPPHHTRLRKPVARHFTVRRVEKLRPAVEDRVAAILDEHAREGGDLLEELAYRLPIEVIADLLGIEGDLTRFRAPSTALTAALDPYAGRDAIAAADDAYEWFADWFDAFIAELRSAPTDGLASAFVNDDAEDRLSDVELRDLLLLLFVAGFETTSNVISAGIMALHDQPEQLAILRANPDLSVADELLRHSGSIHVSLQVPVEDVEVGGQLIPAGETVMAMLGAANRDPAVFADPDRLDFARDDVHHVAFGGGLHHCLGAALARLELDVLFSQLATRFDRVDVTGAKPRFRNSIAFQGLEAVPAKLVSSQSEAAAACPWTGARTDDDAAWREGYRKVLENRESTVTTEDLEVRVAMFEAQPFFSGCRPSALVSLATTAYPLAFEAGEDIVVQGASSDDAYLILEGEADVLIDDRVVATVGADDLVGERGVVTNSERAATVRATGHVSAWVISRERLDAVLEANPTAAATMRAVTASRYA